MTSSIPEPVSFDTYHFGESVITMLYGPSGSGKTETAATADSPEARALIVNTGNGMETLGSTGFRARHPNCKPDIVDVREEIGNRGYVDTPMVYDMVCNVIEAQLDKKKYKTIIIDDLTSLRRGAINKAMDVNAATGKSTSKAVSKKLRVNIVAVQDFGMEMSLVSQFIAAYSDIFKSEKVNLIILAHERLYYKKAGIGEPAVLYRIRPAVTGQTFPDDIPQFFDVIGYCHTYHSGGKSIYKVKFSLDNMILAKNRFGGVGYDDVVDNFNFTTFLNTIQKS
jgi:hypothetical protein